MEAKSLLILIFLFWLIEFTFVNAYFSSDNALYNDDNLSADITSYVNESTWDSTVSAGSISKSFVFMLAAKMPTEDMPGFIAFFISGINWLLIAMTIICIYRIANPLS